MFQIKRKNQIEVIAGDTGILNLSIDNYTFVDGDIVYFTVKKDINDTNYKFQKVVKEFEDNVAIIKLSSKDTNLEAGEYLYDIQLSLKDGRVDTVVSPTLFEVVNGVTND